MDKPKLILVRPKSRSEAGLHEAAEQLYRALTDKGPPEPLDDLQSVSSADRECSDGVKPDGPRGDQNSGGEA